MPEAITKYAINSTLGTDDFKPLDVLIKDLDLYTKRFVASDDTISHFDINLSSSEDYGQILFNPSISGVVRLHYWNDRAQALNIEIYENEVLKQTVATQTSTEKDVTVTIRGGNTYFFRVVRQSGSLAVSCSLSVLGTVRQYGYFSSRNEVV